MVTSFLYLPNQAQLIFERASAPEKLVRHCQLVHHVLAVILDQYPVEDQSLDDDALLGAALHDVGKIHHPEELDRPGKRHELAGEALLINQGFSPAQARFCRTHGLDHKTPELTLADLLVMLADKIWKGARIHELERRVLTHLGYDVEDWDAYMAFDQFLEDLACDADTRLTYQNFGNEI